MNSKVLTQCKVMKGEAALSIFIEEMHSQASSLQWFSINDLSLAGGGSAPGVASESKTVPWRSQNCLQGALVRGRVSRAPLVSQVAFSLQPEGTPRDGSPKHRSHGVTTKAWACCLPPAAANPELNETLSRPSSHPGCCSDREPRWLEGLVRVQLWTELPTPWMRGKLGVWREGTGWRGVWCPGDVGFQGREGETFEGFGKTLCFTLYSETPLLCL